MSGRSPYIVAVIVTMIALPAASQSLCVECQGPDRSYSCSIKDGEKVQAFRSGKRAREFLCISETARTGGHQSCRITTSYSGPCMGQPFEIDLAKLGGDAVVIGPGISGTGQPGGAQPQSSPPTKEPPQTLEELARQTMAKSKEQMSEADKGVKKAGDAVGGAVKKTWDCMTSLFQRC
jgi:hypothetical protein